MKISEEKIGICENSRRNKAIKGNAKKKYRLAMTNRAIGLVFDRNDMMFDDVSSFYLPLASGVAGGDIARLISSNEGP